MPNARLIVTDAPPLPVRDLGRYLYEPAGAVIRAGAIAELGAQLARATRPAGRIPDG